MSSKTKNAFVIIHFGDKPKYLELEIYFLIMLRNNTKNDIIYMYSISDTPKSFVNIIKKYCTKVIPYDDINITYNIQNFDSHYKHFNTLRTCNFLFAFQLIEYKKICCIESDLVIKDNIDDVFDLKCPAILKYDVDQTLLDKNYKIKLIDRYLENHHSTIFLNGGLLLFKPSLKLFEKLKQNLQKIITHNCKYPNESLFVYTLKTFYNLPIRYNFSHYYVDRVKINNPIKVYHFNESIYKPINVIRDGYIDKQKKKILKNVILFFKKNYYDIYHEKIDKQLASLSVNSNS